MVCLGNICRSPLAEGILKAEANKRSLNWHVDSAGTSGWHAGEAPDPRSIQVARENGLDIGDQRSRQIGAEDFDEFDLIITMDTNNYRNVINLARNEKDREKVYMLLNYLYPGENRAVPDPYYDGGFQNVYDMISDAVSALLDQYSNS